MSPSSEGSWEGAGADIIDLDRYMRGAVRPSRALSQDMLLCEQLVVDGGGVRRKLAEGGGCEHYSHDSGVSDGSFDQRTPHPRRRTSYTEGRARPPRGRTSTRTFNAPVHSDSLRAFRTVCEQALLDQQKQIARVAQLCEQLTERVGNERLTEPKDNERPLKIDERLSSRGNIGRISERLDLRPVEKIRSERVESQPKRLGAERVPSETSDITSSSRSTKDPRRKEKHRTQECKTYKIIMTKLDELNRRFSPERPSRPPRLRTPSSSSVSVCDKLVATDPERTINKVMRPAVHKMNFQSFIAAPAAPAPPPPSSRPRVVAQAYSVDIAPRAVAVRSPNVVTESVIKCESSCYSGASVGDPRFKYDLEDPVHLYSQAKRLQALTARASVRRGRSQSSADNRGDARADSPARSVVRANSVARSDVRANSVARSNVRANSTARSRARGRARSPSICSVCRDYWRSLRQCLASPFTLGCRSS